MSSWKLTLAREGGGGRAVSVRATWLFAPLLLGVLAVALQAGPWNEWPEQPPVTGFAEVVPLDARDPSSLVMSPYWGSCKCECPSVSKPR